MSTILKALKKAEQNCPDQGNKNTASLKFNVRTTLNSRMQRQQGGFSRGSKLVALTLGLVIVATAATYLRFSGKKSLQPELPSQKTTSHASVAAPAGLKDQKPPGQQGIAAPLVLPAAGLKNETAPEKMTVPPIDPPPIKPIIDKRIVDKPISRLPENNAISVSETSHPKHPETIEKFKKTPPSQRMEKITSPTAVRPHDTPDTKNRNIDDPPDTPEILPLEEGILKIQAIAWAQDPAERIAVINNEILGENESVQGYRLLHIKKDEVILGHSDREYKLVFRIR